MTLTLVPDVLPHPEPEPEPGQGPAAGRGGRVRVLVGRVTRRSLGSIVVLLVMLLGVAGYVQQVVQAPPVALYPAPAVAASWLQAPDPATVGYFRAEVDLPSAPTSGILFLDGRDMYRVWVNGRVVATNRTPARQGATPVGSAVDVRSSLKPGRNVLAVQVTALGEDTAALWARLLVQAPEGSIDLGTDSPLWTVTSDAGLTGSRLGAQPEFIEAGFLTDGWTTSASIPAVRSVSAAVPAPVLDQDGLVALSSRGFDAVYTLTAVVPENADGWLRVASTGAVQITVNGRLLTDLAAPAYQSPNSHRPAPLSLVHVGDLLRQGDNTVTFHVTGQDSTALAVGGVVLSGPGWVTLPVGQEWAVRGQGVTLAPDVLDAAGRQAVWPNGFAARVVPSDLDPPGWTDVGTTAPLVALVLLLAVGAAAASGRPVHVTLRRLAWSLAPGCAAVLAALGLGRWITVTAGFAFSPPVAVVVAVVLLAPVLALVAVEVAAHRRRAAWQEGTATDDPARPAPPSWSTRLRLTPRVGVLAIAALAGLTQAWRIDRQPLWQDEATSIVVARAIGERGLPQLDSGLFYFKAEFYHALLSFVLRFTDDVVVLRSIALLFFVGTVLAFGLLLMPVLTVRPWVPVAATAVFVLIPADLAWARDVRMYQQMQFFVVVFLALYLRALRDGRRHDVIGSAVALLAMYFSHEESFVLLPALPLMALMSWRVLWFRRRLFLTAFLPAGAVIAVQFVASKIHPPDFGEDLSNRPYIGWDPDQADFYYQQVFFGRLATGASLALVSTLAVVGIVLALRRRQRPAIQLGIALVVTVAAMSLVLTAKVDRYSFVIMPALVALATIGGAALARRAADALATGDRAGPGPLRPRSRWSRGVLTATVLLLGCAILSTMATGPRSFGLWAAQLTGSPNPLTHSDYAPSVDYLREHMQPGDEVVTLAPPVMTAHYLDAYPDRIIQTGRNKLLYLLLRDGEAIDTILGVPVLLTAPQLRSYLEANPRVWLVSDAGSYLQGVPPDVRAEVTRDFRMVFQDATTTVSLWDAG